MWFPSRRRVFASHLQARCGPLTRTTNTERSRRPLVPRPLQTLGPSSRGCGRSLPRRGHLRHPGLRGGPPPTPRPRPIILLQHLLPPPPDTTALQSLSTPPAATPSSRPTLCPTRFVQHLRNVSHDFPKEQYYENVKTSRITLSTAC